MTAPTTGIALALLLCGAPLYAAETKNVDKTLPLSATGTVTLDSHNGSIQIRTWDRAEVEIHVRIEARGPWVADRRRFDATSVDITGAPDAVSIRSMTPDAYSWGLWSLLGAWGDRPDIRYAITAPRRAQWKIHEHNGHAEIHDVDAALAVGIHNGSVRVVSLSGPLDLSMHNGAARIDFSSFTHASRIDTHNGTVELALPASSKFQLDARGHNIRVNSDFPVAVRSSSHGQRNVNGSVNGGGPVLQLTSHNGGFRILSKR